MIAQKSVDNSNPEENVMHRKLIASALLSLAATFVPPALAADTRVEMTWMSIANWYFKIGDRKIMMDAYITRVPGPPFFVAPPDVPGDLYAYTQKPATVDVESIKKVREAVLGNSKLDYLLVGHSHFDHSWDTPTWSTLTGAPLIGGKSTCLQAEAQGVAKANCRSVSGGEKIVLGEGITMRVVRFNHSGDNSNPIQHFPRELYRPPVPDTATGGLRAGVGEDYPNGGGNRAFLFTIDGPDGQVSFFVNNSSSAFDLDKDVIVDGVSYGSPMNNLRAAMADAGLTQVDAWIGTGGKPVAEKIVPIIRPKVYIPNHWDGLFNPFWKGLPYPYKDDDLKAYLDQQKIPLLPQKQYFDTYVLTRNGVTMQDNRAMKARLGFSDEQRFSSTMLDAVQRVASTSMGDDCGEGFAQPNPWASMFAMIPPAK
jgi:L-ascorbate metabolism protein UlaG (beta-lactamase superfamily)